MTRVYGSMPQYISTGELDQLVSSHKLVNCDGLRDLTAVAAGNVAIKAYLELAKKAFGWVFDVGPMRLETLDWRRGDAFPVRVALALGC